MNVTMKPIGTMKSLFHFKNGTPRQASVCHSAPGILTVEKTVFNNPEHSIEGLQDYSHAWVIFVFHKNNNSHTKAKVKPPRLDGKRTGVFSSRSPYRPNNIGLSLLKIDKIEGATIHFSGVDMIDGTPVLDIKPYIPEYDSPTSKLGHGTKLPLLLETGDELQEKRLDSNNIKNSIDNNTAETSTVIELEKGFLALSSALDKAGSFLASHSYKDQKDVLREESEIEITPNSSGLNTLEGDNAQSTSSNVDVNDDALKGAIGGGDDDLDLFLGAVLSHAVESLSSELDSYKDQNYSVCELPNFLENAVVGGESKHKYCSSKKAGSRKQHYNTNDNQTVLDSHQTSATSDHVTREAAGAKNFPSASDPVIAPWLLNPPVKKLTVTFTTEALQQLQQFSKLSPDPHYQLQLLSNPKEAESAIRTVLHEDPRSVYRRQHCKDSLYFFTVDVVHITCWFDEDVAQVVRLKPVAYVSKLHAKYKSGIKKVY